jgi:hypothetical protein
MLFVAAITLAVSGLAGLLANYAVSVMVERAARRAYAERCMDMMHLREERSFRTIGLFASQVFGRTK